MINYFTLESTLLLHSRVGPSAARLFPRFTKNSAMTEIFVDEETHGRALELFARDKQRSLTDAVTVHLMERLRIENLATYDERSFGDRPSMIIGKGYWHKLKEGEKSEVGRWETASH